jgi:hypothetical protein
LPPCPRYTARSAKSDLVKVARRVISRSELGVDFALTVGVLTSVDSACPTSTSGTELAGRMVTQSELVQLPRESVAWSWRTRSCRRRCVCRPGIGFQDASRRSWREYGDVK